MNWKHFVGAVMIVGAALVRFGAPVVAVLLGAFGALLFAVLRARRRAA